VPPAKRQIGSLWHLLPRRGLTFGQRFVGVLATWGLPILVWRRLIPQRPALAIIPYD